MIAHWVDTTTDEEARALDRQMWDFATRKEADGTVISQAPGPPPENGEFWSHALDRIKDDPDQRYAMARRHLPLPAAWREMAVALRTKIRTARKETKPYEELLRELHHLAAMSSYAGYGPIQRVPYARIARLDLAYDRVGFRQLPLLGVTDGKWMVELWGEPSDHTTAAELYAEMLAADLRRIEADEQQEKAERMDRLFGDWNDDVTVEESSSNAPIEQKRRGILGWLFGR
jgi:hypothetical protein